MADHTLLSLSHPAVIAHLQAIRQLTRERHPLGPESQYRAHVPHGTLTKYAWTSRVFPGTVRDWWIYAPPGTERTSDPLPCMIFQDGWTYADPDGGVRTTHVLDNLIAQGDLPRMAAIFLNPGVVPAPHHGAQAVANRSFEYDTISDQYARFLIEEILPYAGSVVPLSAKAEDRGLCGISSGGICSFLAAWYRPDAFTRVLSHVGSFADIRGGHHVPSLVRTQPRRPLRVLLQAGVHDLDIAWGNWWLANLQMEAALAFAGYDFAVAYGSGDHSVFHGAAILPDSLRWLWRR